MAQATPKTPTRTGSRVSILPAEDSITKEIVRRNSVKFRELDSPRRKPKSKALPEVAGETEQVAAMWKPWHIYGVRVTSNKVRPRLIDSL